MRGTDGTYQNRTAPVTSVGLLFIVAGLSACAPDWPDTGFFPSPAAEAAPDAQLLTGPEMAGALATGSDPTAQETAAELDNRAAALRSRAAGLNRPVLAPSDANALQQAAEEACLAAREESSQSAANGSPSPEELCISR